MFHTTALGNYYRHSKQSPLNEYTTTSKDKIIVEFITDGNINCNVRIHAGYENTTAKLTTENRQTSLYYLYVWKKT